MHFRLSTRTLSKVKDLNYNHQALYFDDYVAEVSLLVRDEWSDPSHLHWEVSELEKNNFHGNDQCTVHKKSTKVA